MTLQKAKNITWVNFQFYKIGLLQTKQWIYFQIDKI